MDVGQPKSLPNILMAKANIQRCPKGLWVAKLTVLMDVGQP